MVSGKIKKSGLNFWTGAGEKIEYIPLPPAPRSASSYESTTDLRNDYKTNISPVDNLTLEEAENRVNTKLFLANKTNLPADLSITNEGLVNTPKGSAGGFIYCKSDGGLFSSPSSQIAIAPGIKGYSLDIRNMVFKHELMHAWHWNMGIGDFNFNKYSERATSAFSLKYVIDKGEAWLGQTYRENLFKAGGYLYPTRWV